jgi:hypothetical protein
VIGHAIADLLAPLPSPVIEALLALMLAAWSGQGAWHLIRGLNSGSMTTLWSVLPPYNRAAQPILFWMNATLNALYFFGSAGLLIYALTLWLG